MNKWQSWTDCLPRSGLSAVGDAKQVYSGSLPSDKEGNMKQPGPFETVGRSWMPAWDVRAIGVQRREELLGSRIVRWAAQWGLLRVQRIYVTFRGELTKPGSGS